MLDIKINNQSLVLDDISINIDKNNPVTNSSDGSLVYSFDVPNDVEGVNAGIIGYLNEITTKDPFKELRGKVYVDGIMILEGKAVFLEEEEGRLSFEIYFDNGEVFNQADSRYITELPILDEIYFDEEGMLSHFEAEKLKEWPAAKYGFFPVNVDNYLSEDETAEIHYEKATATPEEGDTIYQGDTSCNVLEVYDEGNDTGYVVVDQITDFFYDTEPITFQVTDTDEETADIITNGFKNYYRFPKYINRWDSINNKFYRTDAGNNRPIITPFIYLSEVVHQMVKALGYQVEDRFFSKYEEFKKVVILNIRNANLGLDATQASFGYRLFTSSFLPRYSFNDFIDVLDLYGIKLIPLSAKNVMTIIHVSDIVNTSNSITELPDAEILKKSNYEYIGITREMEQDSNDELMDDIFDMDEIVSGLINDPVDTFSDLENIGSSFGIWYVKDEHQYYQRNWSLASGFYWQAKGNDILMQTKYVSLDGSDSISAKVSPVYYSNQARLGYASEDYADMEMRLAFVNGQPDYGSYSLFFDGDNGMINRFFIRETNWRLRRRAIKLSMPNTKPHLFPVISHIFQSNNMQYIIDQIRIALQKNGKSNIEIDAYTL